MLINVYEPVGGMRHDGTVAVRPNSFVEPQDDTTAQYLADQIGAAVLTYERPGTVSLQGSLRVGRSLWPSRHQQVHAQEPQLISSRYARYMDVISQTGQDLTTATQHFDTVILSGHSAGGLEALSLATSNSLANTKGVAVSDPCHWHNIVPIAAWLTTLTAQKLYFSYQRTVENQRPKAIEHEKRSLSETLLNKAQAIGELAVYSPILASDLGRHCLLDLTIHRPDLALNYEAPENTYNGSSLTLDRVTSLLTKLRDPQAAFFRATVRPGTYHSDYTDNPALTVLLLEPILEAVA